MGHKRGSGSSDLTMYTTVNNRNYDFQNPINVDICFDGGNVRFVINGTDYGVAFSNMSPTAVFFVRFGCGGGTLCLIEVFTSPSPIPTFPTLFPSP